MKSPQQETNTEDLSHSDAPKRDKTKKSRFSKLFGSKSDTPKSAESQAPSNDVIADTPTENTIELGLTPSSNGLLSKLSKVFKGTFDLDDELFEELEETLMSSDIGVQASLTLVDRLRERVQSERIHNAEGVLAGLRAEITELLSVAEQPWVQQQKPFVLLMVGVNGVGKTTTTAKIAQRFKLEGKSVMLAAADTFRAAAVEQLEEWGKRLDIPVITQGQGADAAAVAHDALNSALARDIDVLIIDTAGRLHTQTDLMEQLQKVNRVLQKIDPNSPHEVLQVLDAGTGQNALTQLEHFQKVIGVNSLCLSKLDGSAKGGVAIALTEKYKLPIRFIGVGESFDDLLPFSAHEFAKALVPSNHKTV